MRKVQGSKLFSAITGGPTRPLANLKPLPHFVQGNPLAGQGVVGGGGDTVSLLTKQGQEMLFVAGGGEEQE